MIMGVLERKRILLLLASSHVDQGQALSCFLTDTSLQSSTSFRFASSTYAAFFTANLQARHCRFGCRARDMISRPTNCMARLVAVESTDALRLP